MEVWKDVVGYEGLYQVSDEGRVRSLSHTTTVVRNGIKIDVFHPGKIIRPQARQHGYLAVCLYGKGGNKRGFKQLSVHRMVAEAFLGCSGGLEVNHKNEVKTDNRAENLEWVTRSENMRHGTLPGRIKERRFGKSGKPVIQRDKDLNVVGRYPSAREAERQTGVKHTNICQALLHGHRAGGYYWQYAK